MADDIVQRLVPYFHSEQRMPAGMIRDVMDEIERLRNELAAWQATVRAHDTLAAERADEIEQLRAEVRRVRLDHITTLGELQVASEDIDRLRVAGDALAEGLRRILDGVGEDTEEDDLLATWKEARRD